MIMKPTEEWLRHLENGAWYETIDLFKTTKVLFDVERRQDSWYGMSDNERFNSEHGSRPISISLLFLEKAYQPKLRRKKI